jgi:hypothetical protein
MPAAENAGQFNNLIRETIRLGLIVEADGTVSVNQNLTPKDIVDDVSFLAFVEKVLLADESETSENRPVRYATSWLLAQSPGMLIGWNSDQHLNMQEQMEGDDCYDVTNEGRFAMLCYWARYLGYAESLSIGNTNAVVPNPTEAIARRLESLFTDSPRLSIPRFLDLLSRDCPILETGSVRKRVEDRMRQKRSPNVLSPATSLALWRLEARGLVSLTHASDAETWLMSSSIASAGAGKTRPVSHIEQAM